MSNKNTEINFKIDLNENRIPKRIQWKASEANMDWEEARAIFISIFDEKTKDTLRLDLWINEFPLDEMKMFFFQMLQAMADTYQRATDEQEIAEDMRDFARYFGEKQGLIKPSK
jgi:gliding motility-associated protein GldC